jgi:5-(carboxyamino)imidazole ribonucleotide synthase
LTRKYPKSESYSITSFGEFNHVGLLAVEMFQTMMIIVNEVAPRPHNSGHYSIEGSYTSQFENHFNAKEIPIARLPELWLT